MSHTTLPAAMLLVLTTAAASAAPLQEMPNRYFDSVAAKLIMAGYTDVHVIDAAHHKIAAYDKWGSEVVLVVDPSNRSILSEVAVHGSDQ